MITNLARLVAKIDNPKVAEKVLANILTPGECEEIEKRLKILALLKRGVPQREIADQLNVSISTITRGSRVLKYEIDDYLISQL